MKYKIVVLEDDPDIRELVGIHLQKNSLEGFLFEEAEPFWQFLQKQIPDLIILDLMLPDADGLEICKAIRRDQRWQHIPIIMLTAKTHEMDRIIGLELGADDYVSKPFSPRELISRIKAVLRRVGSPDKIVDEKKAMDVFTIGQDIQIHVQKHEVLLHGQTLNLTPTEFKLLSLLAKRKGWVFSREQILDHLWGNDKVVLDRTIDVHVKNLREKLGEAGRYIRNVRGIGYKLEEREEDE